MLGGHPVVAREPSRLPSPATPRHWQERRNTPAFPPSISSPAYWLSAFSVTGPTIRPTRPSTPGRAPMFEAQVFDSILAFHVYIRTALQIEKGHRPVPLIILPNARNLEVISSLHRMRASAPENGEKPSFGQVLRPELEAEFRKDCRAARQSLENWEWDEDHEDAMTERASRTDDDLSPLPRDPRPSVSPPPLPQRNPSRRERRSPRRLRSKPTQNVLHASSKCRGQRTPADPGPKLEE
ncbi:hypothetical protein C8R46DRAFT_1029321 [Mycena filopes]|nr:hypothetical protein C8R46DRAFT_1029321 [Mycena filopes]